jgi:excinuclease ABC subunit B
MRLSATKSLLERRDTIIVGTVSCIYGIGNPADYHAMVLILRSGDRIARREILERLVAMQYERNDLEFTRGTFRARGETIDIFPAESAELAVRLTLFDDEVESLELFDPLTGKIRQKVPRFTVYPGSHYVTPRDTVLRAIETIKQELRERVKHIGLKDKSKIFNTARIEALEVENLIECAQATMVSAAARHESRGAHTVDDYADTPEHPNGRNDEQWLKHSLWHSASNSMSYKPVKLQPLTTDSIPPKVRTF